MTHPVHHGALKDAIDRALQFQELLVEYASGTSPQDTPGDPKKLFAHGRIGESIRLPNL